jgi:hypothetical protein
MFCEERHSLEAESGADVLDQPFAKLIDVVNHYNNVKKLRLTEDEKKDLDKTFDLQTIV